MRLIKLNDDGELTLVTFDCDNIPEYAILSHTWGADGEEVTFKDLMKGTGKDKPGYDKIKLCIKQANLDGLEYSWVDTCCIDKSSSSELTEAINSMFRWYSEAKLCYAYLSDVTLMSTGSSEEILASGRDGLLRKSRWFTRGWTLQELLAPKLVIFFDSNWLKFGDKMSCCNTISSITGIDNAILSGSSKIIDELYSTRMFWAAKRETSRPEDIAYCLMGLFNVHMPLLYGEGTKRAFKRLQLELFKVSSSLSILIWGENSEHSIDKPNAREIFPSPLDIRPILAESPSLFFHSPVCHRLHTSNDAKPWVVTNRGIEVQTLLITHETWFVLVAPDSAGVQKRYDLAIAILPFRTSEKASLYLGILLSGNSSECTYNRVSSPEGCTTVKITARLALLGLPKKICLSEAAVYRESRPFSASSKFVTVDSVGFPLRRVLVRGCEWKDDEQCLMIHPGEPEESQEALLEFSGEKDGESTFYILISNSTTSASSLEGDWRFRMLRMAIAPNDYAEKVFSSALGLSQHGLMVEEEKITVTVGKKRVTASFECKLVYWDPIHVLKIIATVPEESEGQ